MDISLGTAAPWAGLGGLERAWRKCHSVVKQDSQPITSPPLASACFQAREPVPTLPNHMLFMLHQTPSPHPWSKDHIQSMVHLHSQCSLEAGPLPGGRALKTTPKLEHFQLHNLSRLQHWGSLGLEREIFGVTMAQTRRDGILSIQAPVVLCSPPAAHTHTHTESCAAQPRHGCECPQLSHLTHRPGNKILG